MPIDSIIEKIKQINPKAAEVIKKRKNLLYHITADNTHSLIKVLVETYRKDGVSSPIQIPPSDGMINYYMEQLVHVQENSIADKYMQKGRKLHSKYSQIERTDISDKVSVKLLIEFDNAYNDFLKIHSKALKILATKKEKYPYQTGIQ